MNQAYRVVWNASTGIWQVVSELAKGRGKAKSNAVVLALAGGLAMPAAWADDNLLVGAGGQGHRMPAAVAAAVAAAVLVAAVAVAATALSWAVQVPAPVPAAVAVAV